MKKLNASEIEPSGMNDVLQRRPVLEVGGKIKQIVMSSENLNRVLQNRMRKNQDHRIEFLVHPKILKTKLKLVIQNLKIIILELQMIIQVKNPMK